MADNTTEELLSVQSDSSFVILNDGSLPSSVVEEKNDNEEEPSAMTNTNLFINSQKSENTDPLKSLFFNGMSNFGNEAQDMINQLVEENMQLKETLTQNNLAIKSHLNNFFLTQQEMLKAQETHKQKFSEMKELILNLKIENSDLKKQLQLYSTNEKKLNDDLVSDAKKKTGVTNQNIELLKEEQDKNKEVEISKENLSLKNIELQTIINNLEKEVLKLNEKLEDLERVQPKGIRNKANGDSFTNFSLPNAEARVQISNLLTQLENERTKNLQLKKELEKEKTNSLIVSQNKSTTEELSQCLNKLEEMNLVLEKQTERFNSFNSWIFLAEKNLTSEKINEKEVDCDLMSEINNLKFQLSKEKNSLQENRESLEKMKTDYFNLLDDYKAVQEKIEEHERLTKIVKQLEEKIGNLSQEFDKKNQELNDKKKECSNLKEEIQKLKLKCEDMTALQVQADLYKSDFQEEREARQKLAGEKEMMAEKIRLLQTQIQSNEKDKSSSKDIFDSPAEGNLNTSKHPKKERYVCPKCMFAFSELKMCQDHVENCISTLFYP